jgi:hypothetical protein
LLLVLQRHLVECIERGFATVDPDEPLVDQVVHVLREQYVYFSKDRRLWLQAVQELAAFPHAGDKMPASGTADILQRRTTMRRRMAGLVARHQSLGKADPAIDPADLSAIIGAVYQYEVREWLLASELSGEAQIDVAKGLEQLRRRLSHALKGAVSPNSFSRG